MNELYLSSFSQNCPIQVLYPQWKTFCFPLTEKGKKIDLKKWKTEKLC